MEPFYGDPDSAPPSQQAKQPFMLFYFHFICLNHILTLITWINNINNTKNQQFVSKYHSNITPFSILKETATAEEQNKNGVRKAAAVRKQRCRPNVWTFISRRATQNVAIFHPTIRENNR